MQVSPRAFAARTVLLVASAALLMVAAAPPCQAQEPERPAKPEQPVEPDTLEWAEMAEMAEMMEGMQGMMTPMYRQMAEAMMTVTLEVLARPESAEQLAAFTRNYYEALIEKGFTREEALMIVASITVPTAGSPMGQ